MKGPRPKNLVRCDDYNGHKNILFMMDRDDVREGYHVVDCGLYFKGILTTVSGDRYKVHVDWSVTKL